MLEASCLCGAVRWGVDGELNFTGHCHCGRCRKAHGAAFSTAAAVAESGLHWRERDSVARWESAAGTGRCFCGECGSCVPGDAWQGLVFVPLGNFLADPGVRPEFHIFVASKAPWYEIADTLPRFDAFPPGVDAPVLPDKEPLDPPSGVRGSCLCGGATFVVDGPPLRAHNCHCSRCRRARSAAHASNLFLAADSMRFTRGEELLRSYKLPEAERFTQTFCRVCGGKMPRISVERGTAVVPMGAFDDDPGFRPQNHIYAVSKAPWFEIHDNLAQFSEYVS